MKEGMNQIFTNLVLAEIGAKYGKTPAQVILRWLNQEEIVAIPKSVHKERIEENFAVDNFSLDDEEVEKIEAMDTKDSLIVEIRKLEEVYRLYNIRFEQ